MISVDNITSIDELHKYYTPTNWTELRPPTHWFTSLIPNSSPPVVVGGQDATDTATADIEMYDNFSNSWNKVGLLSSIRNYVTVSAIYNNALIVFGGYTKVSRSKIAAKSSSLTLVELGQAELLYYAIIDY